MTHSKRQFATALLFGPALMIGAIVAPTPAAADCPQVKVCVPAADYAQIKLLMPKDPAGLQQFCRMALAGLNGRCDPPKAAATPMPVGGVNLQRCEEMEQYAIELNQREKAGIDVSRQEAKLEAAIVSAQPHFLRNDMNRWCAHIVRNMR